ncbi:hypothetical protein ABZ656_51930 [Streptomyces sp. NPDC007095]|jgi:hypothetical protein|uniref:hypothetical protein n=1 Tax=Streptomyces sp. NPDC007095 TaxID=3154482 RepID=UPI000C70BADA
MRPDAGFRTEYGGGDPQPHWSAHPGGLLTPPRIDASPPTRWSASARKTNLAMMFNVVSGRFTSVGNGY